MPSSKRTKSRLAAEPTLQSREITRDELARLIGSLPPDVRITIEFHVRTGNPVLTDPEKPLSIAQAAETLNVSPATIMRMAGLVWLEFQSAGRRKIKRITAESVRRLRDASGH